MDTSLVPGRWIREVAEPFPTDDEVPETGHGSCGVGDLDVAGAPYAPWTAR